jgi:hypothetical protein
MLVLYSPARPPIRRAGPRATRPSVPRNAASLIQRALHSVIEKSRVGKLIIPVFGWRTRNDSPIKPAI